MMARDPNAIQRIGFDPAGIMLLNMLGDAGKE